MASHQFIHLDDCVDCIVCGAHYCDDIENAGRCSGDTEMLHGDPYDTGHQFTCESFRIDETCSHVEHSCDCTTCQ